MAVDLVLVWREGHTFTNTNNSWIKKGLGLGIKASDGTLRRLTDDVAKTLPHWQPSIKYNVPAGQIWVFQNDPSAYIPVVGPVPHLPVPTIPPSPTVPTPMPKPTKKSDRSARGYVKPVPLPDPDGEDSQSDSAISARKLAVVAEVIGVGGRARIVDLITPIRAQMQQIQDNLALSEQSKTFALTSLNNAIQNILNGPNGLSAFVEPD